MVESSAAAMAYGLLSVGSKTVLVFDMGGGTLDISVMRIESGRYEVIATGGQSHCGGSDMDSLLLRFAVEKAASGMFFYCFFCC